ncbi:MAG: response regulator [bacterium]|nr:response regulator [bacterium]
MQRATILVADDSQLIQEFLNDLLLNRGFKIVQASNGEEAINLFESDRPDLVMLDVMMPRYSGMEVLRHIKAASPDTIVVIMTVHGSEKTAVEAMKLGADDYLVKPLAYKEVLKLIDDLLEKRAIKLDNKRLKEKIDETETYLAHLIDNVSEAIISTDRNGNIRSFNMAAETLWQVDEESMLSRPLSHLFKNNVKNGYVEKVLEITKEEGRYNGEFVFIRNDSMDFPGHLSISLIEGAVGDKEGYVAVIRDLSSEKELREQLISSARLASLGKVVDGVAHEIRNPLLSMGGFARRLEKDFPDDSAHKKYLDIILADVDRLERMVKDIEEYVDFAKMHKADFKCVDPFAVVNEVASLFDFEGGRIKADIKADNLPEIYADRDHLKELFTNIFKNSVEAMPEGGRLVVDFKVEDNYLSITVEDTGCGIPAENIKYLYDPFYTSKMSGTGIGLAKAYMIVEEHQGFISVDSEEGKGTSITIKLPVERRQIVRVIQ